MYPVCNTLCNTDVTFDVSLMVKLNVTLDIKFTILLAHILLLEGSGVICNNVAMGGGGESPTPLNKVLLICMEHSTRGQITPPSSLKEIECKEWQQPKILVINI